MSLDPLGLVVEEEMEALGRSVELGPTVFEMECIHCARVVSSPPTAAPMPVCSCGSTAWVTPPSYRRRLWV